MNTTEEIGQEFVSHFGTKGMHWGVRREQMRTTGIARRGVREAKRQAKRPASPVRVTDTIGRSSLMKTKIKAVGGEDHPAHPDAIKVAASTQKLKKSGIHTLSNKELQDVTQRLNLESQVHSLSAKRKKTAGQALVSELLNQSKNDPIGKLERAHKFAKTAKRAATVAAVVA